MKNIHIIPTDKPSKIYSKDHNYKLANSTIAMDWYISSVGYKPQNIYITSDEEIKNGDSVILKNGRLTKAETRHGTLGFQTIDGIAFLYFQDGDKKIIITTDKYLIAVGVQAIPDEFLEWFVKNTRCESVKVESVCLDETSFMYNIITYEIIITEEEINPFELPKALPDDVFNEFLEHKQETLAQAAQNYLHKVADGLRTTGYADEDFVEDAKWQAKNMYSEEEVLEFLNFWTDASKEWGLASAWFEQFKKK